MVRTVISPLRKHKRFTLTAILILVFAWSLFSVQWSPELVHAGGVVMIIEIAKGLISPSLSPDVLLLGLKASWLTLTYATAGMAIAIVYAFIAGVLASGILSDGRGAKFFSRIFFRGILGFTRSIHELVWAWLFVAAIGLSPFAAIFALAIPYGGILGRIFADMLTDLPSQPIEALKTSGASRLQLLFYGYLPLVRADFISYTMYRYECAIRSSAIMSFVGLGGLGYQIQLALADLKYNEVWTYVFFLILLVILIDGWSSLVRSAMLEKGKKRIFVSGRISALVAAVLVIVSWCYINIWEGASLASLFTKENALYGAKFFGGMLGVGEESPAFFQAESWGNALRMTLETLEMSIMAIGFATIAAFLTVIPAARNIADGSLTAKRHWYSWIVFGIVRISYIFSRAVPELVWAMLIVFILKPGLLPGAVALALHNFGIIGKLWAEVIEDMDSRPVRNLASAGASKWQSLFYGVVPAVMPKFLTYILYRWEVIMRTTIVVGFVGAGGLGQQFKLSMSFFHYSELTLLLICYMLLVIIADLVSETARKSVK
ncbi:ABC transporter permease subunit [Neobacillus notoginsengisoli]|uniref:ABC transporter permease subunit n=1 Tax=Neobacillus notoginsengisoli TaxID=1578198 RepID=A0A417YWZ9_9BACI|nr:ABC transporter permease subunit [Neobacillus notoginsengisoli]RHW42127.1 ABC transporter permease subunit [Neobacillus notoginsengisoli]